MTIEQTILSEVRKVRELLSNTRLPHAYVNERQACDMLGIGKEMLRKMRYRKILKDVRCRKSGRGYQYSSREIEAYLLTK